MKYKKCPTCDINYITAEGEDVCDVCKQLMQPVYTGKKGGKTKKIPKPKVEGNIAFKCNYCDGGKDSTQIGYAGVCSEANIRENILVKKRKWCSYPECKCQQYINGKFTYAQLSAFDSFCYESRVLIDWKASAGEDLQEGAKEGKNRRLSKDVSGGLCVLTAITPDMKDERERIVFGVFITDKFEEGEDGVVSGFVQCTSKYKIKLSPAEAKQILFWNYYFNKNEQEIVGWAQGLFRYIENYQAAQILRDIVDVKKGAADEQTAIEFLQEFCKRKHIDPSEIPENNGALTRE